MKKRKHARKHARRRSTHRARTLKVVRYARNRYDCYGTHVRSGKSRTKRPRVFCAKDKKKAA